MDCLLVWLLLEFAQACDPVEDCDIDCSAGYFDIDTQTCICLPGWKLEDGKCIEHETDSAEEDDSTLSVFWILAIIIVGLNVLWNLWVWYRIRKQSI